MHSITYGLMDLFCDLLHDITVYILRM